LEGLEIYALFWLENLKGRNYSEDLSVYGVEGDNIRMDLKKIG
jgi:hypothetical protein